MLWVVASLNTASGKPTSLPTGVVNLQLLSFDAPFQGLTTYWGVVGGLGYYEASLRSGVGRCRDGGCGFKLGAEYRTDESTYLFRLPKRVITGVGAKQSRWLKPKRCLLAGKGVGVKGASPSERGLGWFNPDGPGF